MLKQGLAGSMLADRKAFAGKSLASRSTRAAETMQTGIEARAVTQKLKAQPRRAAPARQAAPKAKKPVQGGTQRIGTQFFGGGGTQKIGTRSTNTKKLISIANNSKERLFRTRADGVAAPTLLARVEQLRLLSKVEQLGLLSLLQRNGITLTFIENSGLLETAESLGLLSAAADRNTPGLLFTAAFALYALAPAAVYFLPDDSTGLIAAQAIIVAIGALGGSAAFAGGSLLATLQKDVA